MGRLVRSTDAPDTPAVLELGPRLLIGRSRSAGLRLSDRSVSGEHAVLRWKGDGWELRDLGSANGTWVEDRRLEPGEAVPIRAGAELRFGSEQARYRLAHDGPPLPRAVELETGAVVRALGELLALPPGETEEDAPQMSILRDPEGRWVQEQGGQVSPVADGDIVLVQGQRWRLVLPEPVEGTWREAGALTLGALKLRFTVSLDEETVHISAFAGPKEIDLKRRSYHYLLLTLARAREADAQDPELPEGEHGWLYVDELARQLGTDDLTLNVYVYRARNQLAQAGVMDAAGIVERRPLTRQLRLGTSDLEIRRGG